jgi:uncharacterized protein with NRDE domain
VCTLIVAWRVFEDAPVCIAANRDEQFGRPATPPATRDGPPRVVAPRDEEAGGTWIGYNEHGLFVGVTNRWEAGEGDRSRGLLVNDALEAPSAADALDRVEAELDDREYAPFHLLLADANDCTLVANRGDETGSGYRTDTFDPGVHVVVNVGTVDDWFVPSARPEIGKQQAANAERLRGKLQPRDGETAADWTRRAGEYLGDHDYGVCIHRDGFGTRSSSLIRLGDERHFAFADGPPCENPYEPVEDSL